MRKDLPKSRPPAKRAADSKRAPAKKYANSKSAPPDKRTPSNRYAGDRPASSGKRGSSNRDTDTRPDPNDKRAQSKQADKRPQAFDKRAPVTKRAAPNARNSRPSPAPKSSPRPAPGKKPRLPMQAPPVSKGPKDLLKTLDRVLSKAGIGSRTEARSWIGTGRVRVNGLLVETPDYWVNIKTDNVTLDDKPIDTVERRYILLNKPKGYITTYKDPEGRPTVYDLLKGVDQFVGTVGRLDLDSSGLLLLTNDNDLAEAVTNPAYELEKTYLVKAATLLSEEQLERLRRGVELNDGPTLPAEVNLVRNAGKHSFLEITITEGRNRQVRRMLEAIESKVLKLVRVKLGPLTLEGLNIGTWRDLTEAEIARLASGRVRPNSKTPPSSTST